MDERFPAIRVTMLPKDTNAYGTIFGGVILSQIDLAAAVEVRRHYNQRFVTKAMHEVAFVAPVHLGDLVTFYTRVVRTGRTSVTVDVDVEVERLGPTGTREIVKVTQAEVVYVAVDAAGQTDTDFVMTDAPVFIIDAMNYIFRAFYAVPQDITTASGMPKNAILGYTRTLLKILKEHQPEFVVAAFESKTSFRSEMFADYKATRSETPEGLAPQINYCRKITEAIGIPTYDADSFEADDVIGTIAMKMWSRGYTAAIVTGDKDMSQLVRVGVQIYDLANSVWLDEAGVQERFGVRPHQIPDLLALNGDAVDNIPGVPGVGPKTACQILAVCSGIEDLAGNGQHLHSLQFRSRDRVLRHIRENIESVRMSRKLATIRCDAPLDINPDTVRYRRGDRSKLSPLCEELGFLNLMDEIPLAQRALF